MPDERPDRFSFRRYGAADPIPTRPPVYDYYDRVPGGWTAGRGPDWKAWSTKNPSTEAAAAQAAGMARRARAFRSMLPDPEETNPEVLGRVVPPVAQQPPSTTEMLLDLLRSMWQ